MGGGCGVVIGCSGIGSNVISMFICVIITIIIIIITIMSSSSSLSLFV